MAALTAFYVMAVLLNALNFWFLSLIYHRWVSSNEHLLRYRTLRLSESANLDGASHFPDLLA